jgi:23S rRNA-/tRNA-specific pseudouridylate synthase
MIGARDADLADLIREEFRAGRVRKTYQAVVKPDRRGAVEKVWRDSLRKVPGGARGVKIQRQPGGEPAVTRVLRFSFGGGELGCAFLEVSPETGRTHQIRVQSALRGYPVVGDRTYGNFRFNRRAAAQTGYKRLFLHAVEITLAVVFKGERIEFSAAAPQPPEFEELLG